jgi:hypothetical protein
VHAENIGCGMAKLAVLRECLRLREPAEEWGGGGVIVAKFKIGVVFLHYPLQD